MKILVLIFISAIFISAYSQTSVYQQAVNDFLELDELKHASVGLYAKNLNTGKVIFENNSDISIVPASVLKLFTTSVALEILDPEKRFKTKLGYDAPITGDGTLNGNLYILGYGDPSLGSNYFTDHYNNPKNMLLAWADEVKKAGINKINGSVIAVPVKFGKGIIPNKWMWEDIANYFGAAPTGLNYRDNEYRIHFSTGNYEGAKTEIIKVVPDDIGLTFENHVLSASSGGDRAYIFYDHDTNHRVIRGTLPWKRRDFSIRGSLPYPELYLAQSFTKALVVSGVEVANPPSVNYDMRNTDNIEVFHKALSPKLQEIIDIINVRSFNLYAEALALHLEEKVNKSFPDIIVDFWKDKGMDTNGLFITDACGLSPASGVTPKHVVYLLEYMKNESDFSDIFLESLPVAGESGTLARTFSHRNTKGNIKAKSGSMTRVRAYAGYMTLINNDKIAFCVILNNYNCTPLQSRRIIENFMTNIAGK